MTRFELATSRLKACSSTIELHPLREMIYVVWGGIELKTLYKIVYSKNTKKFNMRARKFNLLRTMNKIDEGIE